MKIPFFDLKRQYSKISSEIESAVIEVLSSGQYILGPVVEHFEREFAEYCGTGYAVGVANGTDALSIALRSMGVKPGDEVIVPAFTFFATAEAVANIGAVPVLADVDLETFCIDPRSVERMLSQRTKVIIPVHLFGHPAPMKELTEIAEQKKLSILEDSAQSVGSRYENQRMGSLGDAGCFSFYPTKNLGACGDGGIITTNNPDIAAWARILRDHGGQKRDQYITLGYNSRLDALQSAILSVKIRFLDDLNERRRTIAGLYRTLLSEIDWIVLPLEKEYAYHTYHQFTIRVVDGRRDILREFLLANGVETMVFYHLPLHFTEPFRNTLRDELRNSEILSRQVLSLPIFPELTLEEVEYIAEVIRRF